MYNKEGYIKTMENKNASCIAHLTIDTTERDAAIDTIRQKVLSGDMTLEEGRSHIREAIALTKVPQTNISAQEE